MMFSMLTVLEPVYNVYQAAVLDPVYDIFFIFQAAFWIQFMIFSMFSTKFPGSHNIPDLVASLFIWTLL